jgi:hypothetical protein
MMILRVVSVSHSSTLREYIKFKAGIFVRVDGSRVEQAEPSGAPHNSRKRFSEDGLLSYGKSGSNRRQPGQRPDDEYFNNPGRLLAPSRYSGAPNCWGVNAKPVLVPEEEVTDAALLKRGLKRGEGDKVCKRGYGANDPENIAIVNMYEKDHMSFEQIKEKLNADRITIGRDPSLSANGCQNRYNRNAPVLFQAEGRRFIPIGQRERGQRMDDIEEINRLKPASQVAWNDQLDTALVLAVKEWESRKWGEVAEIFRQRTGVDMDPDSCAKRHYII